MVGYLRASIRLLRDRRILLGSFLAVILSFATLFGGIEAFANAISIQYQGVFLVLTGFFWPMLWGILLASLLPKDEYRQGTLELLLLTPISPQRLVFAMSLAPILITTILYIAIFPGFFLYLSIKHDPTLSNQVLWTCMLFQPITWFLIVFSVWTSATKTGSEAGGIGKNMLIWVAFGFCFLFIFEVWHRKQSFFMLFFPILFLGNMLFPIIAAVRRSIPFSIEELNASTDTIQTRIGDLFALLRRKEETIFEHEQEVSKYLTLEQIRQQTLGGSLLQEQTVRDVTFTALFLSIPFVLIVFFVSYPFFLSLLRYGFAFLLLLAMTYTTVQSMREILEERNSLRLDFIRITLIPIAEVTHVKEWVAKILPNTVMKWCLGFGAVWALFANCSLHTLLVFGFYALQAWLALSISARIGIRLGLSTRDLFEGTLWMGLAFFLWILVPTLIGYSFSLDPVSFGVNSILLLTGISPLCVIQWLGGDTLQSISWFYVLWGLGFQWIFYVGLDHINQKKIATAW